MSYPRHYSRRAFIRQSGCAALGVSGVFGALANMKMLNAAASTSSDLAGDGDYKALVCLFLFGGNDANNMIIPRSTADYSAYANARQSLAIPRDDLLPISPATPDGRDYGLHPSMGGLQNLFSAGNAATLANVGTLVAPVTRADIEAGGAAVPPQLFSHNDQQVQWQTSVPDSPQRIGWGGRLADCVQSLNEHAQISTSVSIAGTNVFQVGRQVLQYHVGRNGSEGLNGFNSNSRDQARLTALMNGIERPYAHVFKQTYADIKARAIENDAILSAALDATPEPTTVFPDTRLGAQLKMIARLISIRSSLSMRRQVFFCSTGGYDTHADQMADHAYLMNELSDCLAAFYAATEELSVANEVTLFTASDFGRTYPSNGKGSDHAWGSHHMVVGGSVKGGDIYGEFPVLEIDGPNDTGRGRWIPTTSVDEYSATLARWFGVPESELETVLPNIGRFRTRDLGFMQV